MIQNSESARFAAWQVSEPTSLRSFEPGRRAAEARVYDFASVIDHSMLRAHEITNLHDRLTVMWHDSSGELRMPGDLDDWMAHVALQHLANFELWHIEDEARTPDANDADLANVKRRVDTTNQRRNDLAEDLDRTLLDWLGQRQLPDPDATLNSESPGLIIDRLSILALKIYHTREEAQRKEAPPGHAERNRTRLAILE